MCACVLAGSVESELYIDHDGSLDFYQETTMTYEPFTSQSQDLDIQSASLEVTIVPVRQKASPQASCT